MSSHAFRMDMGNLISVSAQSAPPSYTITHAHSFMFCIWRQMPTWSVLDLDLVLWHKQYETAGNVCEIVKNPFDLRYQILIQWDPI